MAYLKKNTQEYKDAEKIYNQIKDFSVELQNNVVHINTMTLTQIDQSLKILEEYKTTLENIRISSDIEVDITLNQINYFIEKIKNRRKTINTTRSRNQTLTRQPTRRSHSLGGKTRKNTKKSKKVKK